MSDYYGHDYNYDASPYLKGPHLALRDTMKTGESALDFTLSFLDRYNVTLSGLHGKSVLIELGSIT